MNFDNKSIGFWIELLKKEINFYEKANSAEVVFESLFEKNKSISKKHFLLAMLHELEFISKQNQRIRAVSSSLVFSCISEKNMKEIGFKLFILDKFYAEDLHESDWIDIKKSIYWDIRKNLPNNIRKLGYEHNLESNRKDLVELNDQLEKLDKEYKAFWLHDKKIELNVSKIKDEIKEKVKIIGGLEQNVFNHKILMDVLSAGDDEFFNEDTKRSAFYENNKENYRQKSEIYNFDLIKIFCQIMSETVINYYNYEGEYSAQYNSMINGLHEEMLKRVDRVVGYRLAEDIMEGDKDYPHVSRALMDTFIHSLDKEEGATGKKYFIKYSDSGQVKKIELDLKLVDGALMFKDNLTQGFYKGVSNSYVMGLDNKKIIDVIKKKFFENEVLVYEFLENIIKSISIDFLHPKRVASSGRFLSNKNEIYHIEHELIVYLSAALREKGFIVSEEYFGTLIFSKKLQNFINARLKEVDNSVVHYLDTGFAVPLLQVVFPGQVIEGEVVAKKLLDEILENSQHDRVSLLISGTISNHASIRLENKIKAISLESLSFFGHQKSEWIEACINYSFFGESFSLPDAEMLYIDTQGRKNLNNQFIEKLKRTYKEEINKYKQGLIKKISESLSNLQDNSIDSVSKWEEVIKNAIHQACYPKLYLMEKVFECLHREIFFNHRKIFVEKFNMKNIFIKPSYPLDFNAITALSRKLVNQLLAELKVEEGSQKYPVYYNALMESYNQVLFEWECREIKTLLKKATQELDLITSKLIEKSYFESAFEWIEKGVKTIVKAAAAVGGVSLLFGMTPQALLCLVLLQAVLNASPIVVVSVFIFCYKYILPRFLGDKKRASLQQYEAALLSVFNVAILPMVEFFHQVQLLLALKFPKNREKITRMLIAFVSALVGVMAFVYFSAIIPTTLVAGLANLSPLIFAYGSTAFSFFVLSFFLGINHRTVFEEKLRELLVESLKIKDLAASELEFLKVFKEMEKGDTFLKEFEQFLLKIKSKPREKQLKSLVNFIEARTFDLLTGLPLLGADLKIDRVNEIINHLKKLSLKILQKGQNFPESGNNQNDIKRDDTNIECLKTQIQMLADDAPRRRCRL